MKRRTRIALWIGIPIGGLLLLIAAAGVFFYYAIPIGYYMNPIARTMSLEPVDNVLEGQKFRIPKAYSGYRRQWLGGKVPSIDLKVVLPDMKPYGEDTKHHFRGSEEIQRNPGLRELVTIGIWRILPSDPAKGFETAYFDRDYLASCAAVEFGVLRCSESDRIRPGNRIYVRHSGDRNYAFSCRAKDVPGGACSGFFPLVDRVHLVVVFQRTKLNRLEEIVAKSYRLVCGFYVGSTGRANSYNHCIDKLYH